MRELEPESEQPLWLITAALMMGRAFAMFFTGVFGPLTPFLVDEFGLTEWQVGLCSAAIYAGAIILAVPMGKLIDRKGTRTPLIVGTFLIPVFMLSLSWSTGLPMMLALFLVSGLPRTLILPATEKAVAQATRLGQRALIMGAVHSGPPLAGSLISATLPALAVLLSWRMGVRIMGLALIPLFLLLRSMILRITMQHPAEDEGSPGASHSVLSLITQPRFWLPMTICACFQSGHIILLSFFILYLTEVLALSPILGGVLLGTAQMLAVAGRPGWGVISDRLFNGRRDLPLTIMSACGTVSILILAYLPEGTSPSVVAPLAVIMGATIISARPMISTFAIERAGLGDAAKISSILLVSTWSVFITMPILFGFVVTATGSWRVAWILISCLLAAGGILPLAMKRLELERVNTP